jgi:hypothetical protein
VSTLSEVVGIQRLPTLGEKISERLLTIGKEWLELRVSGETVTSVAGKPLDLLFDNLVVTTSILGFNQPIWRLENSSWPFGVGKYQRQAIQRLINH